MEYCGVSRETDTELIKYYIKKTKPNNDVFLQKTKPNNDVFFTKNNSKLINELTFLLLDYHMNCEFDKYLKEIDFLRKLYLV